MSTNNNTKIRTAKDIPSHVAMSFALFKAQGYSWEKISQGTKINIAILEDIPWAYPKEWARSYAYAEKLVAQETLAETLASLRQELPNADGRMKTQLANTITRLLALQHTRRTSRKHSTFNPLAKPNAIQTPQPPLASCSLPDHSSPPSPKPTTVPQSTSPIAAVLLFLALWCGFGGQSKDAVASPNQSPDCLQPAVNPTRVFGSKAMDERLARNPLGISNPDARRASLVCTERRKPIDFDRQTTWLGNRSSITRGQSIRNTLPIWTCYLGLLDQRQHPNQRPHIVRMNSA